MDRSTWIKSLKGCVWLVFIVAVIGSITAAVQFFRATSSQWGDNADAGLIAFAIALAGSVGAYLILCIAMVFLNMAEDVAAIRQSFHPVLNEEPLIISNDEEWQMNDEGDDDNDWKSIDDCECCGFVYDVDLIKRCPKCNTDPSSPN